jgi:hypothetical protein
MPRPNPHPQTLFHLVPAKRSKPANDSLLDSHNELYVSNCNTERNRDGLEIGYHVPERPRPQVIVEVGRDADLILQGSSISRIHFAFELHPESGEIMFCDRSRYQNTEIDPLGFRTDGGLRQVVLQVGTKYDIRAGGENADEYIFHIEWSNNDVLAEARREDQMAAARMPNPRLIRTTPGTPVHGGVKRVEDRGYLGEGTFGAVRKAIDIDSGRLVAVKKIPLPPKGNFRRDMVRREVEVLSSCSHVRSCM